MQKIKIIKKNDGRIFFTGDLHGSISLFKSELLKNNFNKEQDIVVSAGDLIDRGEDSLACLMLLDEDWLHAVKGNHEEMMISALIGGEGSQAYNFWMRHGGLWFHNLSSSKKKEIIDKYLEKLINLPTAIEVNKKRNKIAIVHGGIYSSDWNNISNLINIKSERKRMRWSKEQAFSAVSLMNKDYKNIDKCLLKRVDNVDAIIFGHTIMEKGALLVENMLWIDTGAYCTGKLSLFEFNEILNSIK